MSVPLKNLELNRLILKNNASYYNYLNRIYGSIMELNPVIVTNKISNLVPSVVPSIESYVDMERGHMQVQHGGQSYNIIIQKFRGYVYSAEVDTIRIMPPPNRLTLTAKLSKKKIIGLGRKFEYVDYKARSELAHLAHPKCSILCYNTNVLDNPKVMEDISNVRSHLEVNNHILTIAGNLIKAHLLNRVMSMSEKAFAYCVDNEEETVGLEHGILVRESDFFNQIADSILCYKEFNYLVNDKFIAAIVDSTCGMGANCIGGELVKELASKYIPVESPYDKEW